MPVESILAAQAPGLVATAARATARPGAPDAALLDAWLALWALGAAGHPGVPGLATALAVRPLEPGAALEMSAADAAAHPPEPAVQAAAVLALQGGGASKHPALAALRGRLANSLNAAWRPAGRFAFARHALPATPSPFEEALAVAAWAQLPDPVPERRQARGRKVLAGLARLAGEGGEATAVPALWAAAVLVQAVGRTGLAAAVPALLASVEARLRAPPPGDATGAALLGLALAAAAQAVRAAHPEPARLAARAAARMLDDAGLAAAPPRAAALALAAAALLPADGGPDGAGPPLRPALR
ncbi:MAG: hypothetical protein RIB82_00170 [Sneathiellaceae bacterium]